MDIKRIVGTNIKRYRKSQDYTQEQLAELTDITSKHLSKIEQGQRFPSPDLIEKLSESLKVSPAALFYSTEFDHVDESVAGKIDGIIVDAMQELRKKIRDEI